MLEQKKKDNTTGFDELAESNKEIRSMKSGDFFNKDRTYSVGFSRASKRSKYIGNGQIPTSSNGCNEKSSSNQTQAKPDSHQPQL